MRIAANLFGRGTASLKKASFCAKSTVCTIWGSADFLCTRARDLLPNIWATSGLDLCVYAQSMRIISTAWKRGCTTRTAGRAARAAAWLRKTGKIACGFCRCTTATSKRLPAKRLRVFCTVMPFGWKRTKAANNGLRTVTRLRAKAR